jgi:DNA-directed RNA polymerase subunit RPC12/RpoP
MNKNYIKKWKCVDCDVEFYSTAKRHTMNYCPKCNYNAVDHEDGYIRILGNVINLKMTVEDYNTIIEEINELKKDIKNETWSKNLGSSRQ